MTATDALQQNGAAVPEMPRFADGMANLQELIRMTAEAVTNEIMDAQAEDACADGNVRNGYRGRTLVAGVGRLTLRIPKLRRGTYFPENLLVRYSRTDRAVLAAVAETAANGVSARKVEKVAHALGVDRMGASQASRICERLGEAAVHMQRRDLSGVGTAYLWLDAACLKCRDGGRVSSCALVTAIGVGGDGYRRVLGLDAFGTETYAGRSTFLRSLRERGVEGVACVTSDAHEGLRRAIEEALPQAAWQRCIVHVERNAIGCAATRQKRAAIGSILHAAFDEGGPALVRELCHLAIDEMAGLCPKAAEPLEEAEPNALAHLDSPFPRHRRLRANNVQERASRELKRRANVAQVLPSRRSPIRPLGAVFSEMDEDRSPRRRFTEASMALAMADAAAKPPVVDCGGGGAAAHAARIMAFAASDDPFLRKAA